MAGWLAATNECVSDTLSGAHVRADRRSAEMRTDGVDDGYDDDDGGG